MNIFKSLDWDELRTLENKLGRARSRFGYTASYGAEFDTAGLCEQIWSEIARRDLAALLESGLI